MVVEVEEEVFTQDTIDDVEGSIAVFFFGSCGGKSDPSLEEEDVVQGGRLYGQDYDQLKVTILHSTPDMIIHNIPSHACWSLVSSSLTHPSL